MAGVDRVTVTLPDDPIRDVNRREKNRSRRCDRLRLSLDNPHPESAELAEQGLEEWMRGLPEKTPKPSSTATPAGPFGGSRARGGWRGASELGHTDMASRDLSIGMLETLDHLRGIENAPG